MADQDYQRLTAACGCGETFTITTGRGRPKKYCSSLCYPVPKPAGERKPRATIAPVSERSCARCGGSYRPRVNMGKYCGPKCRIASGNEAQAARIAAEKASQPARICKWCAVEFSPAYADMRRSYCSTKCEEARQNKARSGTTHRRRAKRFGVPYQHVNRLRVFERDGWRCQLCRRKVSLANAELDHIVPMSKGGPHSYLNTQCSCKQCNASKGDKVLGQQRLFG